MKLSSFNYWLPKELIAQSPVTPRDHSRLLVLDSTSGNIEHRRFYDIIEYFNSGDILVLNNTRVMPCRLIGERRSGGLVDILLCRNDPNNGAIWSALINFNRRLKEGETLVLAGRKSIKATILDRKPDGWRIQITPEISVQDLRKLGKMPLPPYIKRKKINDPYLKSDKNSYQTVYADKDGSIAAPTAGLHFTRPLIDRLIKRGVRIIYLTLHVGPGTFKPIKDDDIRRHRMEPEYFEVSPESARVLLEAYRDKKRIIAVGTTACRVLETIAGQIRVLMIHPWLEKQRVMRASLIRGWTDLFICPPYKFNLVDSLVTNFHLPGGTPLVLAAAFGGRKNILRAYQEAIAGKYRFYSYGDAMFIT